jgi:hypothetical protein
LTDFEIAKRGSVTEETIAQQLGPRWADPMKEKIPRAKYDTEEAWRKAIAKSIENILLQFSLEKRLDPPGEFLRETMSDETFANREQDFEERINATIARDIKQLGQIKTMKAIGIGQKRQPVPGEQPLYQIDEVRQIEQVTDVDYAAGQTQTLNETEALNQPVEIKEAESPALQAKGEYAT